LTVCPFTSTEVDAPLLRVPVAADEENGLDQDSFLRVDKITTVRTSNADAVVGRLEATTSVRTQVIIQRWRRSWKPTGRRTT
jgi:mRNA interferase MazF